MRDVLRQVLVADELAPSAVRRALRGWLAAQGWPASEADDLVLAVSEAVSNVSDHAYLGQRPGEVTLEARCLGNGPARRRVLVTVSDQGQWRQPPIRHENRRRGLSLMRACTASVRIRGGLSGTRVDMISRPVSPAIDPVGPAVPGPSPQGSAQMSDAG